jgi:putative ABC transport system permease protein
MQAVLGSEVARSTGLTLQQSFVGGHGLTPGGAQHDDAPYQVVGVLQPTGTVLDRLILVNSESVWFVHEGEVTDAEEKRLLQAEREITLLLITYRSPLAATRLPRIINADSAMQAAAPAAETARLFELLAPLLTTLRALALALVIMGALALFVTLYRATEERRYDLAILRLMGASRHQLFALVCLEAALMAMAGCLLGLALGHAGTQVLGWVAQGGLPLSAWIFMPEELWLVAGTLMIALLAACLPAWRAASAPVSLVLSQH